MDFSTHRLNKQSTIDNRRFNKLNQSTIDYTHHKLVEQLGDPTLGKGFVAKGLQTLGEAELYNLADYASRKGSTPGRAFVGLCKKIMAQKAPAVVH